MYILCKIPGLDIHWDDHLAQYIMQQDEKYLFYGICWDKVDFHIDLGYVAVENNLLEDLIEKDEFYKIGLLINNKDYGSKYILDMSQLEHLFEWHTCQAKYIPIDNRTEKIYQSLKDEVLFNMFRNMESIDSEDIELVKDLPKPDTTEYQLYDRDNYLMCHVI